MLSISTPMKGAGKGDYYLGLAAEDYYTKGGEPPGQWYGNGAQELGLSGQVKDHDLRQILEGYHPKDKDKLVQNAGDPGRQSGWDLTFSAPKSVSTIWAVADPETKQLIQEAHRKAVHSALDFIQDEAGFTRRGSGGKEVEPAKLTFATFEHGTSRAQDPQIHTHALLMNVGVREDGSTGTVLSYPVFEQKMATGAVYRVELAYQLEQTLNLNCVRDKSCFRVEGSSKALEDDFSKRRKDIEGVLKESGFSGAVASKVAALNTRGAKEHLPRDILFEEWQKVGKEYDFGPESVKELTTHQQKERHPEKELSETLNVTTNKISDKESYFTRNSFVRHAAEEAQGRGLSADEVRKGADDYLKESQEIVFLGEKDGKKYYTTKEILELEKSIIDTARNRTEETKIVSDKAITAAIERKPKLDSKQKDAVKKITQSQGATQIVTGFAGTGKSYMLEAAKDAFEKDGFKVYGAAPSGVAVQGLEEGTGIKSATIHKTLSQIEKGDLTLDKNSVLIIDEAGMVGTKLMSRLFEETSKSGAKLILTGDERQIQSVQAGGALKTLKNEIGFSELTEIRRQREDWAKEAVKSFAEGRADNALKAYAERGLVTVKENSNDAREALIEAWKKDGITEPMKNIIIASTNLDVSILNEKAQASRFSGNVLTGDAFRVKGQSYFEGDRILFTQNSKRMQVANGNLGTITKIHQKNRSLSVKLDSGSEVKIDTQKYDHIKLGYAVTAHKSQGGTFQNSYLFVGGNGLEDKEISYVKASRAKETTRFFMDKEIAGEGLKDITKQMEKSHAKDLASTIAKGLSHNQSQGLGLGK